MTTANAAFVIDKWDEEVLFDDDSGKVYRTYVAKTFTGDLVGTSVGHMTMAGTPSGAAAYVGFERFEVALNGRTGTFLLHHNAWGDRTGGTGAWLVLSGSGTGELAGLTGTAEITRHDDGGHTFTLEYSLDS